MVQLNPQTTVAQQENAELRRVISNAAEDRYALMRLRDELAGALELCRKVADTSRLSRDELAQIDAARAKVRP